MTTPATKALPLAPSAKHRGEYLGWPSWNAWNVSLWLNNDEKLYRLAQAAIKAHTSNRDSARALLKAINAAGHYTTPDGAPYRQATVKKALDYMTRE